MHSVKLIFARGGNIRSWLIRRFDVSPYSHVGIYDDLNGVVYESIGSRFKGRRARRKGLVKTNIDAFKKRSSAWRIVEVRTFNSDWLEHCEALHKQGLEYDMAGTLSKFYLLQLFRLDLGSKHHDNCSEFVNRVLWRFRDDYSPSVGDWWRLRW